MPDLIYSIADITRSIQQTLESRYSTVAVRGEISNFVQHTSGHRYFTLKDNAAQLRAVMWRSTPIRFMPANGMSVIARGKITMYPPNGTVQIECRSMEAAGAGDLQLAFEALKRELFARGWFDELLKKSLPRFPENIGVVTSPTGAAIRDICATLQRRMPLARIVLRPALVQGEEAAEDIARAIGELQQTNVDVIIVGRGGGSIEDIWAFNTEIVAEAIFQSRIPIVSAVGHEIDITIADFVADVRAATPTAAAELVSQRQQDLFALLSGTEDHITRLTTQRIALAQEQLRRVVGQSALQRFPDDLYLKQQQLDEYEMRLHSAASRTIRTMQQQYTSLYRHFTSLYPLQPLSRGFALLSRIENTPHDNGQTDSMRNILLPTDLLQTAERIRITRFSQTLEADILSTLPPTALSHPVMLE